MTEKYNNLVKIALLQISPPNSVNEDDFTAKGAQYCREAASKNPDIILFPELWNIGYTFPAEQSEKSISAWNKRAVKKNSIFVQTFQNLAKELRVAIAITYLEDFAPGHKPRNSVTLFDRDGIERLHYSKVHICDFGDEFLTEPGDSFPVCKLPTNIGDVSVGLMICYDREMPESTRILMLNGAELVLVPNASNLTKPAIDQLSTRAFENMIGVAITNYPSPKNIGMSTAFSPIVLAPDNSSVDNCLVRANETENIYTCEFDMTAIRAWRDKMIWGNKHRRPSAYERIISA